MNRLIPAAVLALLCGAAAARQSTSRIIKCTVDGKVTYTTEPCMHGSIGKVAEPAPALEDAPTDPQVLQAVEERRAFMERVREDRARQRRQDEARRQAAETAGQCARLRDAPKQAGELAARAGQTQAPLPERGAHIKAETLAPACPL